MELYQITKKVAEIRGKYTQIERDISTAEKEIQRNGSKLREHEKAKEIVLSVGLEMQKRVQYHISDITSLALEAVFPEPYKLELDFVERREKTECDIFFSRNGARVNPLDASGGGAVDIAAFALRIASWSLQKPNTRGVIVLDEPMRFVSEDLLDRAANMLKEVSRKLGIQFIIVTHEQVLTAYADKVFQVSMREGVSKVKEKALGGNYRTIQ